jgi:uncharacterized protein
MPVLIEGPTWIARESALEMRRPGAAAAFAALVPPERRCADGELVALSCADISSAQRCLGDLERLGLRPLHDRAAADVALLHHAFGAHVWCPWLELARVPVPGGRVLAARAAGSTRKEVAVPSGWRFDGSRTEREGVVRLAPVDRPLRFLRREPAAAVYVDRFVEEEVRVPIPGPPEPLVVETAAGARHDLLVDVVHEPAGIHLGLMHRERLDADAGMLFLDEAEERRSFWMKNTLVPLDILFLDRAGVIVSMVHRAEPMTTRSRSSGRPCAAVLEVNGGWAEARDVAPGDQVVSPRFRLASRYGR